MAFGCASQSSRGGVAAEATPRKIDELRLSPFPWITEQGNNLVSGPISSEHRHFVPLAEFILGVCIRPRAWRRQDAMSTREVTASWSGYAMLRCDANVGVASVTNHGMREGGADLWKFYPVGILQQWRERLAWRMGRRKRHKRAARCAHKKCLCVRRVARGRPNFQQARPKCGVNSK